VVQADGPYFRYMRAIPASSFCVTCHGPPNRIDPKLGELLRRQYPHDRATGFLPGMIRGAFSLRKPLRPGPRPTTSRGGGR